MTIGKLLAGMGSKRRTEEKGMISAFRVKFPVERHSNVYGVVTVPAVDYREAVRVVARNRGDWSGIVCFGPNGRRVY